MTHAWNQTIEIDEQKASQLIESQHPILISKISLLDSGWDNQVFLVNETMIFRFPRREFGLDCMENEIALLPYIANQVSFPLSAPQWIGQPSDLYPHPFAGYSIIPGKAVSDVSPSLITNITFATTLATWLSELHAIPVTNHYAQLIKGEQGWRYDVNHRVSRCKENLERYENHFIQLGFDKNSLLEVIAKLPTLTFQENKKSYLHADLYSRHVVMNPETGAPTGLIDWGDTHIGHPGIDLAVGMIFTEEAFQRFISAYGHVDNDMMNLSLLHAFCHHMSFLPYTCEQNKPHLMRWAAMVLARTIDEISKRVRKEQTK